MDRQRAITKIVAVLQFGRKVELIRSTQMVRMSGSSALTEKHSSLLREAVDDHGTVNCGAHCIVVRS